MTYRWLVCIVAALTLVGCKTTVSSSGMSQATASSDTSGTQHGSKATSTRESLTVPSLDGAPAAERVDFAGDTFRIARADGSFVLWSVDERAVTRTADPARDSVSVLAWSPGGALAIVAGSPPVVVRLEDAKEVLRFVKVEQVETAGFFPDGSGLYVGEASGKLHVWNESEQTLDTIPTENLESFIARQSSELFG